jgi:hypothetical protein
VGGSAPATTGQRAQAEAEAEAEAEATEEGGGAAMPLSAEVIPWPVGMADGNVLSLEVPSPRHRYLSSVIAGLAGLAEVYLRVEIDTDPGTYDAEQGAGLEAAAVKRIVRQAQRCGDGPVPALRWCHLSAIHDTTACGWVRGHGRRWHPDKFMQVGDVTA